MMTKARILQLFRNKDLWRSPYVLLQEIYWPDGWKILISCMMLNQTGRKQVDQVHPEFFKRYPTPSKLIEADQLEVKELIKSLGFKNRRYSNMVSMSKAYLVGFKDPIELPGIGEYASDAWKIFMEGEIVDEPRDHALNKYIKWKKEEMKLKWDAYFA